MRGSGLDTRGAIGRCSSTTSPAANRRCTETVPGGAGCTPSGVRELARPSAHDGTRRVSVHGRSSVVATVTRTTPSVG